MSLEGRLEDLGLADIFQIISLSKRSGVLTIVRKEGTGRLVFSRGQLVYASSDTQSRLGYSLIKKGLITSQELENALKRQKGQETRLPLGTHLVHMEAITQETLEKEIKIHLTDVVKDIMGWDRGSFHFELGGTIQDEVIFSGGVATDFLLLEAARQRDEDQKDQSFASPPVPPSETGSVNSLAAPVSNTPGSATHENTNPDASLPPMPEPSPVETSFDSAYSGAPFQSRKDLVLLNAMIEELSAPSSSSEITLLVLRYASELMARAVIFLVRAEDIVGLGQFGLTIDAPDDQIRAVRIPLNGASVFQETIQKKAVYKGPLEEGKWHRYLFDQIGGETPADVFVAPLISDGRVIALLYGDNAPSMERIGETEGLEAFIKVAGFAFGKAILERKLSEKNQR